MSKKTRFFLIMFLCYAQLILAEGYISMGSRIQDRVTSEVCKRYRLETTGIGGAFFDELNGFTVGLKSSKPFLRKEARKMFIEIRQLYAEKVNECRPLRPYLHTYPFCPCENVGIFLSFPEDSEITLMLGSHGKIKYEKRNASGQYETIFEESYDEARALVFGEKGKDEKIKGE